MQRRVSCSIKETREWEERSETVRGIRARREEGKYYRHEGTEGKGAARVCAGVEGKEMEGG